MSRRVAAVVTQLATFRDQFLHPEEVGAAQVAAAREITAAHFIEPVTQHLRQQLFLLAAISHDFFLGKFPQVVDIQQLQVSTV